MDKDDKAILEAYAEGPIGGSVAARVKALEMVVRIIAKWVLSKQPKPKKKEEG